MKPKTQLPLSEIKSEGLSVPLTSLPTPNPNLLLLPTFAAIQLANQIFRQICTRTFRAAVFHTKEQKPNWQIHYSLHRIEGLLRINPSLLQIVNKVKKELRATKWRRSGTHVSNSNKFGKKLAAKRLTGNNIIGFAKCTQNGTREFLKIKSWDQLEFLKTEKLLWKWICRNIFRQD